MSKDTASPLVSAALRRCLRSYTGSDFRADLLAGLVVGIIAVPLSMALAISTGVPPEHGLYTAIIAGGCAALLGGADLQVSGPTAAFVVILAPIVQEYGLGGLCLASAMAGALIVLAAVCRLGRFIKMVPDAVTLGFTGGIGITIAVLQLKDFFGLDVSGLPEQFFSKAAVLLAAMPTLSIGDTVVGAVTLAMLLTWPKISKRIPPAFAALSVGTLLAAGLRAAGVGHAVRIADRFGYMVQGGHHAGIPRKLPTPSLHWLSVGHDLPLEALARAVWPSAVIIAALAALESLLAAVVADQMSGRKHDSDSELFGIGIGNIVAPLFGGFAATGAIARTAANIRSGARSPVASVIHAAFVIAAIVILAPVLSQLPMAAMSALLLTVAWNMANPKGIVASIRSAPRQEASVLLVTLGLTVAFDMVVGVACGVLLHAAMYVLQRAALAQRGMSTTASFGEEGLDEAAHGQNEAQHVIVHAVQGPLMFSAAQEAFAPLTDLPHETRHVVLDLSDVPMLDEAGVACVEQALEALEKQHIDVVMVAPDQPSASDTLLGAGLLSNHQHVAFARSRAEAVSVAQHASATRA